MKIGRQQRNPSGRSQRSWRTNDKNDTWSFQLDHQARSHDSQFMEKRWWSRWSLHKRRSDETTKIIDQSVPFQCFTNWFSTMLYNRLTPNSTATNSLSRQDQRGNSRRQIILWRTDLLHQKAEHGKLTCGWWRLSSRRRSIRYSMMQCGDLSDTFLSVNNTSVFWKSCTLINVPPYWRTGTKQGDLLSSLLFNSVLQSAMEKDIETWNEKGLGIKLGGEKRDCISNLRFADDVLMMANSLMQLKKDDYGRQKRYRSAWAWHSARQNEHLTNQKSKQIERNRDRRDACRNASSRRKSQIYVADDHTHESSSYRGAAQKPPCLIRARQTFTGIDIQVLLCSDTGYTLLSHRQQCTVAGQHGLQQRNTQQMIRTTQRRMLRLTIQTKIKDKKTNQKDWGRKDLQDEEMSEDTQEEDSTNDEY